MKKKEFVIEYTEADIAEMRAEGIDEDAIPKVGKHVFKRVSEDRLASRTNSKVRINTYVDLDVLQHFRKRAEGANAAPYQTQINAELRKVMERDLANGDSISESHYSDLLENEEFLAKLAEKLKERGLQPA